MTTRRRSRGEAILLRLPSALLDFPFEVLISVVGLVIGLGVLTGFLEPTSITALLPEFIRASWGAGLFLGGGTIAVGIATRRASATSAGLRLLAFLFVTYAVALIASAGLAAAGAVATLYCAVGILCGLRSLYISVVAAMLRDIGRSS